MAQSLYVDQDTYHTMTLTGQGHVMAAPDVAVIRLGVQSTGTDLAQIQNENAQISQDIIQSLMQSGNTDIKTIEYTVDKSYEYDNGKQIDKGYSVRHILEIRTDQINEVGTIVDALVKAGSNVVSSISFELSDPNYYYQQALNLAVDNAIQKAKSISANFHLRLNSVPVKIMEGNISPIPIVRFQREAAATPILAGELKIEAFVTTDFLYTD